MKFIGLCILYKGIIPLVKVYYTKLLHTVKGNTEEGTTKVPFCHYPLGLCLCSFHVCEQNILSSIHGGSYQTFPVMFSPGFNVISLCLEQKLLKSLH
jgi:hypothetical protein